MLQSGADVDARDSNDMTALHHACVGLHGRCVNLLLHCGADHRAIDKVHYKDSYKTVETITLTRKKTTVYDSAWPIDSKILFSVAVFLKCFFYFIYLLFY
jgi:hypothetical protein